MLSFTDDRRIIKHNDVTKTEKKFTAKIKLIV